MILIIDFGSQYTHLIARRIKELGGATKITTPEEAKGEIKKLKPLGIILSGGPASVYAKDAPTIDASIFNLNIPILGVCYGMMLIAHLLDGKVISGKKEYGPARITIKETDQKMTQNLPQSFTVWMSHGDEVVAIPKDYIVIGSTEHVPFAFIKHKKKDIFGIQFHPEVHHTEYGVEIYRNFITLCKLKTIEYKLNPTELEENIVKTVGDSYVIGAVSGGVDSTVAGVLTAKAIGKKFIPIYVENGLMRDGTKEDVEKIYRRVGVEPLIVHVEKEMLTKLKGKTDPEEKRKVIGAFFIEVFEREMERLKKEGKKVDFLLQGTIYSDVIESKGTKHAENIKSHHNVGGLPKHLQLKLLEPLREFYKDEVREMGTQLGIPEEFVQKQKFPGPGFGIRIRGEVTEERLAQIRQADHIVLEELKKADLLETVFHSFPVMTGALSTSVKGDGRFFGEVIALRVTTSVDEMTFDWAHLPYKVLQSISSRIVNEVPKISRLVYDITTKPPATAEWE
ncbi:MAG: glutamine-hydrolyzing GMP synthase [Patescibacteria group bacterium]